MNILKLLETRFSEALTTAGAPANTPAMVCRSAQPHFGDYQCNAAMTVAKQLGVPPHELAQTVIAHLALDDVAEDITVAGPGFINVVLSSSWLAKQLQAIIPDDQAGIDKAEHPQTVVIDYSAPNVAKEMHVGHLRSTIIGDAMARLLAFLGHNVIRQNHLGDWGTQFGMLIAHLEGPERHQHTAFSAELNDLETFYREAKRQFDDDPRFAEQARHCVVKLQTGDSDCIALWKQLVDATVAHNQAVYDRLNISLTPADVMGESAYNSSLPVIVETLASKNLLTEDQGAQVVFLDEFKNKQGEAMGVIVEKSDGGYLYTTTDLAAIRHRCHTLNADRLLYYVDARQSQHFAQIFAIARKAGFANSTTDLAHHAFGMMLAKDGKPFKTRSGNTIKLADLLDEAEERAARIIAAKSSNLDEEQKVKVIQAIAIGALKYADLSKSRTRDYVFDWDAMLTFEGNTAPYLLYAYTRIMSLFRKSGITQSDLQPDIVITEPSERLLVLTLHRFSETLAVMANEGMPHYLCAYLYELAGHFMAFYETCPINKENVPMVQRNSRLQICRLTARILDIGLDLLGIETVEHM